MLEVREWDTNKAAGTDSAGGTDVFGCRQHERTSGGYYGKYVGRRPELVDTTGIIDYGSLIYIALQRSKSAREAIKVMTDLVKDYGYYSSGETFSIADKNEAWVMELIGKGPGNKGAVWVAIRVPDDCISAHANQSRIHQFDMNDKENCMYSPDVISFAREKGYFNGVNKDFSFSLCVLLPLISVHVVSAKPVYGVISISTLITVKITFLISKEKQIHRCLFS